MKEHEGDVMPSVDKSSSIIDSTATVDGIITERLGGGEGKSEGLLTEKDEGEDMMVDVVGSDAVEDDHEGTGVVSFDSNTASEPMIEDCTKKETEARDLDMEVVAGSGQDCDALVGIRVLTSEKAKGILNEEEVAGLGEDHTALVGTGVLTSEKDEVIVNEEGLMRSAEVSQYILQGNAETTVASGSNGDVEGKAEVDDRGKEEDSLHPTSKVMTDDCQGNEKVESLSREPMKCDQEVTDGDHLVNEKIGKENEVLDSSDVSKPSSSSNPCSEDVDMVVVEEGLASKDKSQDDIPANPSLVCPDERILSAEVANSATDNGPGEGDSKLGVESSSEVPRIINKEETDGGLTKDEEIVEQPTEPIQEMAYENGVMDDKTGKGDEVSDPSKIPESLITVYLGPEEVKGVTHVVDAVKHPVFSYEDADMATAEDAGVDIDQVLGWKDEVPGTDAITGAEKDQYFDIASTTEADVGHGLLETSSEPVLIKHGEENLKSQEADAEQGLPESFSEPVQIEHQEENLEFQEADVEQGLPESSCERVQIKNQEENLKFREAHVEQGLLESSSEPVKIEHREENFKSREPIVYGRRVHVEVPLYTAPVESISPVLEDENLDIETDSEEDDESVEEEEQKAAEDSSELLQNENSFSLQQPCYFQPPENEGEFSVSDLVWGKVRSHPWWPGQIIDPSDASNKAMKYHKKDCFLVAYFGDHTFAWNSPSVLKPFRAHFSQTENQTNLEAFKIAVKCALEEVTRRVELGLACSCIPREIYKMIEYQEIENGGVRRRSSRRHGFDESANVSSFEPDKLVDYVRLLALFPDEGDKLELSMAKAQLSSYGRYKGYRELPEFWIHGDLLEDVTVPEVEQVHKDVERSENKLIEISQPNKEISLSDITDDAPESGGGTTKSVSSSGLRKRKAHVPISNGSVKKPKRQSTRLSTALNSSPKPSFRIGEVIQRVASQLSGPPSVLKSNNDRKVENGQQDGQHVDQIAGSVVSLQTPENSKKEASVPGMLSQLHLTAQDPMKDYTFLQTIIPFFYERRAAVFTKSLKKHSANEKPVGATEKEAPTENNENDPEEFEFVFDDVNDSYWTDRIIQNQCDEQPLQDNQNGVIEHQVVAHEQEKPAKRRRRLKKNHVLNHEVELKEVEEESEVVERRRQNLATEVILKFKDGVYFPSEISLNKMFRRFGPLMESETEVDRQGGRARVVFKRCSDAEVAQSSAEKFKIFGSIDVDYELNYTPLVSYKPFPVSLLQDPMDAR